MQQKIKRIFHYKLNSSRIRIVSLDKARAVEMQMTIPNQDEGHHIDREKGGWNEPQKPSSYSCRIDHCLWLAATTISRATRARPTWMISQTHTLIEVIVFAADLATFQQVRRSSIDDPLTPTNHPTATGQFRAALQIQMFAEGVLVC